MQLGCRGVQVPLTPFLSARRVPLAAAPRTWLSLAKNLVVFAMSQVARLRQPRFPCCGYRTPDGSESRGMLQDKTACRASTEDRIGASESEEREFHRTWATKRSRLLASSKPGPWIVQRGSSVPRRSEPY